jgi:hypothetical protein
VLAAASHDITANKKITFCRLQTEERVSMRDDRQPNAFARPARLGDRLVTTQFIHNRGFAAANDPDAEVCIALGTELAFDQHIECEPMSVRASPKKIRRKRAHFSQMPRRHSDVDVLQFKDGLVVPLKNLRLGQFARVLKLPFMSPPRRRPACRRTDTPKN